MGFGASVFDVKTWLLLLYAWRFRVSEYRFRVSLFYSYCHADESYRERMETALKPLRKDGDLTEWSDRRIIPGTPFGPQIMERLKNSDVVVFLGQS